MLKKIQWKAIVLGFLAKVAIENAINAVLFFIFGSYMLVLGSSPWWLYERFRRSPIGWLCGILAALAAYWGLGFVIGRIAKRAPFFNVGTYLVIEIVLSLIALGLNMPRYARVSFWESVVVVGCIVVAFLGALSVDQIVKRHA